MSNDGDEENINNKEETVDEGTASNIKVATTNTKSAKRVIEEGMKKPMIPKLEGTS